MMLFNIAYSCRDRDGNASQLSVNYEFEDGATLGTVLSYIDAFASTLRGISDAVISSGRISLIVGDEIDARKTNSGSVYNRAVFLSLGNSVGKAHSLNLPAFWLDLCDVNGPLAGKRILDQIDTINAQFAFFTPLELELIDDAGERYFPSFVVGGLTQ